MQDLANIAVIRALLARHGIAMQKSFGQNFLVNPSVCPRMAALSTADAQTGVLEIGPGIGVLTAQLAPLAKKVVAVEIDRGLLPVLKDTLAAFDNVTVVNGDVLELDLPALLAREFAGMRVVVCANLPYYITSPVLMRLLESRLGIAVITVMVQKEAAQRICAPLGTRQAGALTAAVHYYAQAEQCFTVSPGSFYPPPKVESAVIRLHVRKTPPVAVEDEAALFRVIKAAFGQRRKTVCNALSAGLPLPKDAVTAALEHAGVAPTARAETLTLQDFAAITQALQI